MKERRWIIGGILLLLASAAIWVVADLLRIHAIMVKPAQPPTQIPGGHIDGLLLKLEQGGRYDASVDFAAIDGACRFLDGRWDTADFRLPTLIRLLWLYGDRLDAAAAARIKAAPLANLVDFAGEERNGLPGDDEIATKAAIVLDLLLYDLVSQSWKGVFVSTMGRAYEQGKKGGGGDSLRGITQWAFGSERGAHRGGGMDLNLILSRKYRVPAALRAIALDPGEVVVRASTGLDLGELRGEGLIGEKTLLKLTHAYFPRKLFHASSVEGQRAFGRIGDAWVALVAANPISYAEGSDDDLVQKGARTAWVCELGSLATDHSFAAFKNRVMANAFAFDAARRVLSYSTTDRRLALAWGGGFTVNGEAVATDYPRFDSPWVKAPRKPDTILIEAGGRKLELSFDPMRRIER